MTRRTTLLGLDAGTTSVRCVVFDHAGRCRGSSALRQRTYTPKPGWVEQDPEEIFLLAVRALRTFLHRQEGPSAIGITNQRESLVAVDARTGRPLSPLIVWQDTRTADLAAELSEGGWGDRVWDQGGLPLTTYPTAPKIRWLLDHIPAVRNAERRDRLLLGTLDTWLLFRLMGGAERSAPWITDASNASRTLLYDLEKGDWAPSLLEHFGVPRGALAEVRPSFGAVLGEVAPGLDLPKGVPLAAVLGDQQASLLGLNGLSKNAAKLTFGTGAFFLARGAPSGTGRRQGLIRTVLYESSKGERALGLEGGVGAAGAFLEWLGPRGIGLFSDVHAIERAARAVKDSSGTTFVPALAGLFAPHWRPSVRGTLHGLTRSTTRGHLARAAFEGVAHRVADILEAHRRATPRSLSPLWADGGLAGSGLLLQMVADLSGVTLARSPLTEATARGAALAAGLSTGTFDDPQEVPTLDPRRARRFFSSISRQEREDRRSAWRQVLSAGA